LQHVRYLEDLGGIAKLVSFTQYGINFIEEVGTEEAAPGRESGHNVTDNVLTSNSSLARRLACKAVIQAAASSASCTGRIAVMFAAAAAAAVATTVGENNCRAFSRPNAKFSEL